jgi:uncharacterized delta-60 repeat protein
MKKKMLFIFLIISAVSLAAPTQEWNRTWSTSGDDLGYGIAMDPLGNVYMVGYTWNPGVGSLALIVKYDSSGTQLWNRTWGGSGSDSGADIAFGGGDIYIVGQTFTSISGSETFIAKYNGDGDYQWNRTWGETPYVSITMTGRDIALGPGGDIYITGQKFNATTGNANAFLVKYNSNGDYQWNMTWGGVNYTDAYGVATDAGGDIYVVGLNTSFGASGYDAFLAKYDSSGTSLWNASWDGAIDERAYAVAVDSSGNIYTTGQTNSFGAGWYDALLLKYDSSGNYQWNRTWGGSDGEDSEGIAVDSSGDIYIAGYSFSWEPNGDAFLVKYNSSGDYQWNRTWGGIGDDEAYDAATDSSGNAYMAGYTASFSAGGDYDALFVKFGEAGAMPPGGFSGVGQVPESPLAITAIFGLAILIWAGLIFRRQ